MKKAFHILFAIYFISLVAIPCGDKEGCNEVNQTQTSQTNHKEKHSDEGCTPFCSCACCVTHFIVKSFQPLQNQIAVINKVYTVHPESETSTAIIPIWQPPKLA